MIKNPSTIICLNDKMKGFYKKFMKKQAQNILFEKKMLHSHHKTKQDSRNFFLFFLGKQARKVSI